MKNMNDKSNAGTTGFELPSGDEVSATTALELLGESNIASFTPLGLKGRIHIEELCDQNFGLIASSDTLRKLAQEILVLADQADDPDYNQTDIRELIDTVVRTSDKSAAEADGSLTAHKEHAHCIQMALLYAAKYRDLDASWVKKKMCELSLDATLALLSDIAVPGHYRDTLAKQLANIPGYQPLTKSFGVLGRPESSQNQEVYRNYGFFTSLIQRAAQLL